MASTWYHAVKGEIIGETTSGSRTSYLTDGLGSVTATQNATGTTTATWRYMPYGSLLTKTGAGADPRFLWRSYERTALTLMQPFRAAPYYSSQYGFCARVPVGVPTTFQHPLSQDECGIACRQKPLKPATDYAQSECGGWGIDVQFRVTGCPNWDGYVVQQITMMFCYTDCEGRAVAPTFPCKANGFAWFGCYFLQFYEAWHIVIVNGQLDKEQSDLDTGAHDFNRVPDRGRCTRGLSSLRAVAGPMSIGEYNAAGFVKGGLPDCAGGLRATLKRPPSWPPKKTVERLVRARHSCCCDGTHMLECTEGEYSKTTVEFPKDPCSAWR